MRSSLAWGGRGGHLILEHGHRPPGAAADGQSGAGASRTAPYDAPPASAAAVSARPAAS